MAHETCNEMLAMYALSALEASEQRELQEHLVTCAVCRLELREWQATAAALAYVATPIEPSAQLREQILQRVRKDDGARSEPGHVLPFKALGSPSRSWWPRFAAVAASIAVLALAASLLVLWRQHTSAQRESALLSQELKQRDQDLARQQKLLQVLLSPSVRSFGLEGTKNAPNASAIIAVDRQSGQAVLSAQGLPSAPNGKAYQLWFISAGEAPAPGQVFIPNAAGIALLADQLPPGAARASIFAVTLEPQSGVPAPTGAQFLLSTANGGL